MSHNAYGRDRPSTDDKDDQDEGEPDTSYEFDEVWYLDGDGLVGKDRVREIVAATCGPRHTVQ